MREGGYQLYFHAMRDLLGIIQSFTELAFFYNWYIKLLLSIREANSIILLVFGLFELWLHANKNLLAAPSPVAVFIFGVKKILKVFQGSSILAKAHCIMYF